MEIKKTCYILTSPSPNERVSASDYCQEFISKTISPYFSYNFKEFRDLK